MIIQQFRSCLFAFGQIYKMFSKILHHVPLTYQMSRLYVRLFYSLTNRNFEVRKNNFRLNATVQISHLGKQPLVIFNGFSCYECESHYDILPLTRNSTDYCQSQTQLIRILSSINKYSIVKHKVMLTHYGCLNKQYLNLRITRIKHFFVFQSLVKKI